MYLQRTNSPLPPDIWYIQKEYGNPMNSKVGVGYGASIQLSKDGEGNIHYTDAQSGQISSQSIKNYTTAQTEAKEKSFTGAIQKMDTNGLNVVFSAIDSSSVNQNNQASNSIKQGIIDKVNQSESFSQEQKDAVATALDISASVGSPAIPILNKISPLELKIAASLGISASEADTLVNKIGKEKASQIAQDFTTQYTQSALMNKNVSANITRQNVIVQNNSLTEALAEKDSFVNSQQVSNSINNNDLSSAIKHQAEQLAMQDGIALSASSDMALHQRYTEQAFSQMIQGATSFNSLSNNIGKSAKTQYHENNNVDINGLLEQGQNAVKNFGSSNMNEVNNYSNLNNKLPEHNQAKENIENKLKTANSNTGVLNYGGIARNDISKDYINYGKK